MQSIISLPPVYTGGPLTNFLKETGFRETDKETISAGEESMALRVSQTLLHIPGFRKEANLS